MEIRTDLPAPEPAMHYPFPHMEVGSCIEVPSIKHTSATTAARIYGKRHGLRFASRQQDGLTRIWRVG